MLVLMLDGLHIRHYYLLCIFDKDLLTSFQVFYKYSSPSNFEIQFFSKAASSRSTSLHEASSNFILHVYLRNDLYRSAFSILVSSC